MTKDIYAGISQETVYRYVNGAPCDGILSCGFMRKLTVQKSQINFKIPYYSCFVLLSGSGKYWDETGFQANIEPGSVVQRLPERVHSTQINPDGNWLEFYVSFGKSTFNNLVNLDLLDVSSPVLSFTETEKQLSNFVKLITQMKNASVQNLGTCFLDAQQIAIMLTNFSRINATKDTFIAKACHLLELDLDKKLSLNSIAKQLCIGYETFRKEFKKEMNISPEAYRQQKRMQTAQLMLLENQPIKSIAQSLGYSDIYSFSKQFKRYFGYSPTHLSN